MKESVAVAKEADAKKGFSPTRSDKSIHRVRNEPERQIGSLRGVIGNIRRDGGTPSVESIATELSGMPTGERAPALLTLQQTHGNRYVQRVVTGIQAKLVVGQPGDKYEQEADRVADDVVSQINAPHSQSVQRQDLPGAQEVQLQRKPFVQQVRRMSAQQHPTDGRMAVTPSLGTVIQQARGRGQALPDRLRRRMEHVFEADFNGVGIHTDAESERLNRSLQARAFTASQDIFFRQGAYSPGSEQGQKLIAHELTHVVQQSGTSIQTQVIQLTPTDDFREALRAEPEEICTRLMDAIDRIEFADLPEARNLLDTMIYALEGQMWIDFSTFLSPHDQTDMIRYFRERISSLEEEEAEWEELQEREAREFEEYIREEREYVPGEEPTMSELPPEQEMLGEPVPVRPRQQPEFPAVRPRSRAPPGQQQRRQPTTEVPPTVLALGRYERAVVPGGPEYPMFERLRADAQQATGLRPVLLGGMLTRPQGPGEPSTSTESGRAFTALVPSGLASATVVQEAIEGGGALNIRAIYLNTSEVDFYRGGPLSERSASGQARGAGAQTSAEYRNLITSMGVGDHQVDIYIQHEGGLSVIRARQRTVEGAPLPDFLRAHLPPSFFPQGRGHSRGGGGSSSGPSGADRRSRARTRRIARAAGGASFQLAYQAFEGAAALVDREQFIAGMAQLRRIAPEFEAAQQESPALGVVIGMLFTQYDPTIFDFIVRPQISRRFHWVAFSTGETRDEAYGNWRRDNMGGFVYHGPGEISVYYFVWLPPTNIAAPPPKIGWLD